MGTALLVQMLLGALLGLSVYLPLRCGQLSLATPGFFAIGGTVAALLSTRVPALAGSGSTYPITSVLLEMALAALLTGVLALGLGGYLIANQLTWSLLGYPVYQMPMGFGFFRALPLFFLGMALAWFAEKVWIAPKLAGWAGIGAALMLAFVQYFDKHALISLACIAVIILAAGAVPTPRPSKWVEKAAQVSFSMFITNEVVRIAWFGVVNVMIAKFALPVAVQWGLWGLGILAAFVFAFLFHALVDTPIQDRIRAWRTNRSRRRLRLIAEAGPAVPLKG